MPLVLPRRRPSSRSSRYTKRTVSPSSIWTASSSGASAKLAVTRPIPMPSVIELEPVDLSAPWQTNSYRLLPGGSASTQRTLPRRDLRYSDTPASVPPVPLEATKASTEPCACDQISGPVVSRCARRFAVLSNWFDQMASGNEAASRAATFWYWFGLLYGTV